MKKLLFISSLSLLLSVVAYGQSSNRDASGQIRRGHYLTNQFGDNWFVQFGAGAGVYFGGQNGPEFGNRIRPTFDLGLGKWITPTVGIRLQGNYTPGVRQYSITHTSPFNLSGRASNGFSLQKFDLINVHSDFLWNMSAAIGGYKDDRVYEIIPYAGLGWGQVWNSATSVSQNEITANFGIINKFRVSPVIDVNLELRGAIVNGRFDLSTIDNKIDAPVAVVAGLSFKLGKTKEFARLEDVVIPEYYKYEQKINRLQAANESLKDKVKLLDNALQEAKNTTTVTKVVEEIKVVERTPSTITLFFAMGSTVIEDEEIVNLDQFATYIKDVLKLAPQTIFTITGSADSVTGSQQRNKYLSEKRAQVVHDTLVSKYGIDTANLKTQTDLNFNERFGQPYLSRSVTIK